MQCFYVDTVEESCAISSVTWKKVSSPHSICESVTNRVGASPGPSAEREVYSMKEKRVCVNSNSNLQFK